MTFTLGHVISAFLIGVCVCALGTGIALGVAMEWWSKRKGKR